MFHLIRKREEKQHNVREEKKKLENILIYLIISLFSNPNADYQEEHRKYNLMTIPLPFHFRQPFNLVHLSIPVPVRAFLVADDVHIVRCIRTGAGRRRVGSLSKQMTKQAELFSKTCVNRLFNVTDVHFYQCILILIWV